MLALTIHAKTRKKELVNCLNENGLCIAYNRVQSIESQITDQLCYDYNSKGFVCPSHLKENTFTIAAIDNIDHNPSSSTATLSFHGTSISIFQQHTDIGNEKTYFRLQQSKPVDIIRSSQLPVHFTQIAPINDIRPEPPKNSDFEDTAKNVLFVNQSEWVEKIQQSCQDQPLDERSSFSGFHSSKQQDMLAFQSLSALLLLITESINSFAVVHHCQKIIMKIVSHLNPSQMTIITGDQLVYALGKQVMV